MKKQSSTINVLIDAKDKEQATKILNELGLTMSNAINMYLKQIIKCEGIPFEITNKKNNVNM